MSTIEIKEVNNKKELNDFIQFHYDLYKGDPFDAPNLRSDELNTFNPKKNAAFEFCQAQLFLAYKDGKIVGRIAAIINNKANKKWKRKDVRFGWIDFIDDKNVSKALLKAVAQYGKDNGMDYVVGPLGFTDMDPEGMLTYGFEELGTMATSYNRAYYPQHMEENGGWKKDNDYVEYKLMVPKEMPQGYQRISDMITKRYNLHVKKLTRKDIFKRGYGQKLFDVINETFKDLYGYSELSPRQIEQYVNMYFPLADLSLITIIEDRNKDNKIVGVGISIPSLSKALQRCNNGRLLPFGWWYALKAIKFHKTEVVDLLLVGIREEYRSKGANALLFSDLIPKYRKYGFKWAESHVQMETNMNAHSQWKYLDATIHKRRRCYIQAVEDVLKEKK